MCVCEDGHVSRGHQTAAGVCRGAVRDGPGAPALEEPADR